MSGFQNRLISYATALLVLASLGSGCARDSINPVVTSGCGESSDCEAGQFCRDDACYDVCGDSTDCESNFTCKDLLCVSAKCGDGLVEGLEECDDKLNNSNSAACTQDCKQASCGDGYVWAGEEACDDSNTDNGDGCDSNCTVTACGNGVITAGEECDDGNTINSDGCEGDCQFTECNGTIPDGTPCESDGLFCNGIEVCGGGNCISPGNPCSEDEFDCTSIICDETAAQCSTLISEGSCFIGGTCIPNETVNQENSCQFCDSTNDPLAWQIWGGDLTYTDAAYSADEGKSVWQSCGTGACEEGIIVCDNASQTLVCSTSDQVSNEEFDENTTPYIDNCNGLDDDCDGTVDEHYFWDFSNYNGVEADFWGDYSDSWLADLPLQASYSESADPNSRLGTVYGRNLPQGDHDNFRIKVYEADDSWGTSDKAFTATITISAPLSYNLYVEACWSSYNEHCKYNAAGASWIFVSEGTSNRIEFKVDPGTMTYSIGSEPDVAYLDISIEPDWSSDDYGCDEYQIDWDITEEHY